MGKLRGEYAEIYVREVAPIYGYSPLDWAEEASRCLRSHRADRWSLR